MPYDYRKLRDEEDDTPEPMAPPAYAPPKAKPQGVKELAAEIMAQSLEPVEKAQTQAAEDQARNNWGRIGGNVAAALGGYGKADNSFYDRKDAEAQRGVAQAMQRGAMMKEATNEARGIQAADAAAAKAAEENDPASATSQQTQGLIAKAFPQLADSIKGMSHAKLVQTFPVLEKLVPKASSAAPDAEKAQLEKDLLQARIDALHNPKQPPAINPIQEERMKLRREQFEFEKGQHKVVGFEPDANAPPSPRDEANKLREAAYARDVIKQRVEEAKALLAEVGRVPSLMSTKGALIQQKIQELKQPMLTAMGTNTMTDSHLHLLEAAGSQSPTEFFNVMNPQRLPALLEGMRESSSAAVRERARHLGLHENGNAEGASIKGPSSGIDLNAVVRVRSKKTGAIKALPAAQAQKYLSSPDFEQVQ